MDATSAARDAVEEPPRVLVIDDDETVLALARLSLSKNGFEVQTAATAASGLELLATFRPHLVVCDVVMPDLLGWEVVRRIRQTSAIPILMLSGRSSDVDKARGLDLGADDYLTKPFAFLEFEARVRALLRRVRSAPAADNTPRES
jgi:DNA-binding response OmpR family regulator